jgi:DNA-binding response OmpR family regulator
MIELTRNEIRLLSLLLKNKENITSREDLMNELWQSDEFVDENTLTVNINRLRKKIETIGLEDYIKTKRGIGYYL